MIMQRLNIIFFKKNTYFSFLIFNFLIFFFVLSFFNIEKCHVFAEVIFDGSMNPETKGLKLIGSFEIKSEYGKIFGENLFHSFSDFNINTNEIARFTGNDGIIKNIINRITGDKFSYINGAINSEIPGANMYILNPNGVILGSKAQINIDGSFYISTADYLKRDNMHFYSKINENTLLFTEDPSAFGFFNNNKGKISIKGEKLENEINKCKITIKPYKSISIISSDIEIVDCEIYAPEARINLSNINSNDTEVKLTDSGIDISSDDSNLSEFGKIKIDNSILETTGTGSGSVYIFGGDFNIINNSEIKTNTLGNKQGGLTKINVRNILMDNSAIFSKTSSDARGGSIEIKAQDSIMLYNESELVADSYNADNFNYGEAGNILINAPNISLINSVYISSDTYKGGKGGNITINSSKSIYISNESKIFSVTEGKDEKAGAGGSIHINCKDMTLINNSVISSDTFYGYGQGGEIIIKGLQNEQSDSLIVHGSYIFSGSIEGHGNGGKISIKSNKISFVSGGQIGSESTGSGKGGEVNIYGKTINLYEKNENGNLCKIYTSALFKGENAGDAGNIFINADSLSFDDKSNISASTNGHGNAGEINLIIDNLLLDSMSFISSSSDSNSSDGNAGLINMNINNSIILKNNSSITTSTNGTGNAGNIQINLKELLLDSESIISSSSNGNDKSGHAGTIIIKEIHPNFHTSAVLKNKSKLTTSCNGRNIAGSIQIDLDDLYLNTGASISSTSNFIGIANQQDIIAAGSIQIHANNLIEIMDSETNINTSTQGQGIAGGIFLSANKIKLFNGALISSSSNSENIGGKGGEINFNNVNNLMLNNSFISTSSFGTGDAGNIKIEINNIELQNNSFITSESNAKDNGGFAGMINIIADESIYLNTSSITTEAVNTYVPDDMLNIKNDINNGRITINNCKAINLIDSTISSSVLGGLGNGGDIVIENDYVTLNHSKIIANAYEGNGGNISIVTLHYIKSSDSSISASSKFGLDGTIFIDAPDVDIGKDLIFLPANFLDASPWLKTTCELRSSENVSRLIWSGKDAISITIKDLQPSLTMEFSSFENDNDLNRKGYLEEEFFQN